MKIISHRGNLAGRQIDRENSPSYIEEAVSAGFDVEVDIWRVDGNLFLGHDLPQYKTDVSFLRKNPLWCHAKNIEALKELLNLGLHCFWHDVDVYTLTSKNEIWCYSNVQYSDGIMVCLGKPSESPIPGRGVCTDHPVEWMKWRDFR